MTDTTSPIRDIRRLKQLRAARATRDGHFKDMDKNSAPTQLMGALGGGEQA